MIETNGITKYRTISDFQHFSGTQADNKGTRKQAKCASKRYMNKHITVGMARISTENL